MDEEEADFLTSANPLTRNIRDKIQQFGEESITDSFGTDIDSDTLADAGSAALGYMSQYGMTREQAADLVNLENIAQTGLDLTGGEGYGATDLRESTQAAERFLGGLGSGARGQTAGSTRQTTERLSGQLGTAREAGLDKISTERRRNAAGAVRQAKIAGSLQKVQLDAIAEQEQKVAQSVFGGVFGAGLGLALTALFPAGSAYLTTKALLVAGSSKLGGDIGGAL